MSEDTVERLRAQLRDVVEAARAYLADYVSSTQDSEVLCLAIQRLDGRDDHDWTAWGEPYEAVLGWFHSRLCRCCGTQQFERVPPQADDLLERVLIAQLPDDCDGCDPGDCQCSIGRKDGE